MTGIKGEPAGALIAMDYHLEYACVCVLLTALVYVRRDVDGGGVVGDEPLEGGVDLKIVRNVAVLLPLRFLRLIELRE